MNVRYSFVLIVVHGLAVALSTTTVIETVCEQEKQALETIIQHEKARLETSDSIQAQFSLALHLLQLGHVDEAIAAYDHILERHPYNLTVLYNRGYAFKMAGRLPQAISAYKTVLHYDPENDMAHFALGHAYLNNGDFINGWKQHERYLKQANRNADKLRLFLAHGTIAGKKIVCIPEGGIGDTLQFIRHAQTLHLLGAHVIALVQKPLKPLISLCPFIDSVVTNPQHIPPFHDKVTYMTLPAVLGVTEQTIEQPPYLVADAHLVQQWQHKIAHDYNFKIGICWQADVHNDESRPPVARRGIPLKQLEPLFSIPNTSWYCLQKREGLDQLAMLDSNTAPIQLDDFDESNGSFMDSAALIKNLDLVITIDSAVAHLAGGLGRPVWLLLPYATDWRWIAGRTDSPWYPTMTIFKQPAPFDWKQAVNTVQHELSSLLHHKETAIYENPKSTS